MSDTPEARERRLSGYEARFIPKLASALIRSCERAASAVEQGATPEVAAAYVTTEAVELVLTQLYKTVLPAEASIAYDELTEGQKAQAPPTVREGWLARATRFLRGEGRMILKGLTERTQEIVRDVLTEAIRDGVGVREAATRLRQQVTQISRSRAEAIVRTETVAASNAGSLQGAVSTGLKLQKAWLATASPRTRPTHTAANGQRVALDGFFQVGSSQGRYPGDPLLAVGERARCRCTITYKPVE